MRTGTGIATGAGLRVGRRILLVGLSGIVLYVLAPSLLEVFEAWPRLTSFAPWWFAVMLAAQLASFACVWYLQTLVFRDVSVFTLITSQLASNAFSRIVPGGAAAGGALQYRMLSLSGADPAAAATGLTAVSLITTATVFGLPLFTIPAVLAGLAVPPGLEKAALIGMVVLVLMFSLGTWLLVHDTPLLLAGRLVERVRRRFGAPTDGGLGARLIRERQLLARSLGANWFRATLASFGKWLFDYLALVAALSATGDATSPSLVLLAYVAGAVLAMIPITPGGLGFVEAGLTTTLVAAGVAPRQAVLATLAYRLVSYWIPMLAGMVAYVAFRIRHPPGQAAPVQPGRQSRSEPEVEVPDGGRRPGGTELQDAVMADASRSAAGPRPT